MSVVVASLDAGQAHAERALADDDAAPGDERDRARVAPVGRAPRDAGEGVLERVGVHADVAGAAVDEHAGAVQVVVVRLAAAGGRRHLAVRPPGRAPWRPSCARARCG